MVRSIQTFTHQSNFFQGLCEIDKVKLGVTKKSLKIGKSSYGQIRPIELYLSNSELSISHSLCHISYVFARSLVEAHVSKDRVGWKSKIAATETIINWGAW